MSGGGDLCFLPFNINGDLRKIPSSLQDQRKIFKNKTKQIKNKIQKMTKLKKSKALLHKDH